MRRLLSLAFLAFSLLLFAATYTGLVLDPDFGMVLDNDTCDVFRFFNIFSFIFAVISYLLFHPRPGYLSLYLLRGVVVLILLSNIVRYFYICHICYTYGTSQ